MSWTDMIDHTYTATRASAEEEAAMECHREGCDSPVDETKPCEVCGDHFCPAHLYDGLCKDCFAVDAAAEELECAA